MYKIISFLLIIFLLVPGCEKKENKINEIKTSKTVETMKKEEPDSANIPEIRKPKTEEDFLMIIDFIPLNSSYDFINQVFPGLSEIDRRFRRYYKAYYSTIIFDRETKLEFTMSTDFNLQNVFCKIHDLNNNEADSLYIELQQFYTDKFGAFEEEISRDPGMSGYPILHHSLWEYSEFDILVGLNKYSDNCMIAWGYQKRR